MHDRLKAIGIILQLVAGGPLFAAEPLLDETPSETLGRPIEYAVLLPESGEPPYPLVLMIHGGGGDRSALQRFYAPHVEALWESGELPPLVVVAPTIRRGEKTREEMEAAVIEEFLPHVRELFPVSGERELTIVTGYSSGAARSARWAFKNPDVFGATIIMAPFIAPSLTYEGLPDYLKFPPRDGQPVDEERYQAENPASIVAHNPQRIRESNLEIYLECGDSDSLGFHEGAEFLHRTLWEHRIPHEYRLVRWADHIGTSVDARQLNSLRFIARYLEQPVPVEENVQRVRRESAERFRKLVGYEPFPFWPHVPRKLEQQE